MSVSKRITAIRLAEKIKKNPGYAEELGVKVNFISTSDKNKYMKSNL